MKLSNLNNSLNLEEFRFPQEENMPDQIFSVAELHKMLRDPSVTEKELRPFFILDNEESRALIDHIIISKDLKPGSIQGEDAAIVRLDKSATDFSKNVSDHVPPLQNYWKGGAQEMTVARKPSAYCPSGEEKCKSKSTRAKTSCDQGQETLLT